MSRARDLAKLGNTNVIAVNGTDVGFGTLDPKEKVNVVGVVSATSFYGDGSTLEGIASAGIGTALSDDKTKALNTIYYTNDEVLVTNNSTIDPPASGHIAYTQAPTIVVDDAAEITVADGDDLLVDVLGITTGTNVDFATRGNGVFGNIYVDNIESQGGQTSVNFPKGLVSTGVATFHSDVSIGGTLTYEDVKNVDSVGLITARTGIKVTAGGVDIAGGGIDIVGDIGLGAGKQTGTAGQLLTSGGPGADASWTTISSDPAVTGIASGSITAGRGVCVADDGKLLPISGFNGLRGTQTPVGDQNNSYDIVYSTGADKFVIFYRDQGDGDKGKARVGTQGTGANKGTITWGAAVQFTAASCPNIRALYDSTNDKVAVLYRDSTSTNAGSVVVGSISGSTLTFGTPVQNATDQNYMEYNSFCYCPNTDNYAIVFNDGATNKGWCRIGKYSGTNSSTWPNNKVQFLNAQARETGCWYDTTANKLIIVTNNGSSSNDGQAFAGTVSGDNVTFGSGQTYNNDTNDQMPDGVHDPDTGKNIISYRGSSAHGYCRTATLSGTTFTFGTEYRFSTDSVNYPRIEYDSAGSKKFLISYTPYHSSQQWGETIVATLTGDVITYDTKYQFSDDGGSASTYPGLAYSPDSQSFVAVYHGTNHSPAGAEYFVENIRSSNVTAGNYVGVANASYTNGQTASVSIPGAVNTAVSGLTVGQKYYVLANGTLNTTADDANIVAGNTVAANKLIVR